ncbi:hypothetical protein M0P48_02305 [Candidatus Gracilibacteria bacterium]|nr:hypothetical protein [Candidatus Gracilibacteria bacterium]
MKKIFASVVVSLIVFSGCDFSFGKDVSPEAALPLDSQFVMTFDYSNGEQVKNVKKIIEMLPDYGIKKIFEEDLFSAEKLKDSGISYEEDILPILEGKWKVSFAIDFLKTGNSIVAAYIEEDSKMKDLIEKNKKANDFFYANDGELFVFALTQAEVDNAMKRVKDGNGFSSNENFKNVSKNSKENIGYMYLEMGKIVENLFSEVSDTEKYDSKTLQDLKSQMVVMKDMYFELFAEDDGFGFGGVSNLSDDKALLAKYMPYFGEKLSLIDKIPLENPILYFEYPSIGKYIASFITGFKVGSEGGEITEENPVDMQKDYDEFLASVGGFAGISAEEAKGVLESQFAFALGDNGEKYPTISLYFDVDEKYKNAAKKMVSSMDAYVDEVVKEFEGMIGAKGAFKKEVKVVNGGGVNKLYIDFSAVPDEMASSFGVVPGLDLKKTKIEIYYGLTGDNVLTVALYPDFNKAYGEKTIGENKDVKEFLKKVGENSSYLFFLSPEKLINFLDTNYYKLAKDYGFLPAEYEDNYALIKSTMQALKYFVGSNFMPQENKLLFDAFLEVQKVKVDDALEKVKEGK